MAYIVRCATPDDIEALNALSVMAFQNGLVGEYDLELIDKILPYFGCVSEALVQSGQFYVAEQEGHGFLAAGGWSTDYEGKPLEEGVAHIRHFVVHPIWVRQGLGRAIFDRCLAEAVDIKRFDCQASLPAIQFYENLGFEVVEEDSITLPDGTVFPTCLMRYERPEKVEKE